MIYLFTWNYLRRVMPPRPWLKQHSTYLPTKKVQLLCPGSCGFDWLWLYQCLRLQYEHFSRPPDFPPRIQWKDAALSEHTHISSINSAPPHQFSFFFFFILTFLPSRLLMISWLDAQRPALHSAESMSVEYPSGSSAGEFLIASFPYGRKILFIEIMALSCDLEKRGDGWAKLRGYL